MGLGEVVVAFHVAMIEFDGFYAIVYAGVPGLEFEACQGSVGEDLGVCGVFLYAVQARVNFESHWVVQRSGDYAREYSDSASL